MQCLPQFLIFKELVRDIVNDVVGSFPLLLRTVGNEDYFGKKIEPLT